CGIQMPLVRSWWLGKKKGKEAYVIPKVVDDDAMLAGRRVVFHIGHDPKKSPTKETDGTVGRLGATCVACSSVAPLTYIRTEGQGHRISQQLMATVAIGTRGRTYLETDPKQVAIAAVPEPDDVPVQAMPNHSVSPASHQTIRIYGFERWSSLFTNRQLSALTTFSDLVSETRGQVLKDAIAAGMSGSTHRRDRDADAYADAISTYLAFAISRTTNKLTAICSWDSSPKMEAVRGLFARQQIPMAWDFAEANPFGGSSGDLVEDVIWVAGSLDKVSGTVDANVRQADASTRPYTEVVISTDPPYYDNIGYSDLSDFFYVWLRRALRPIHPDLFGTMLVPKAEELVANPHRHGSKELAEKFFETGFEHVFSRARESANPDYPITVFYAFKQAELEKEGVVSTGWSTFLEGMIRQGWTITATWPVRSELSNRMIASGTNALASSIVLSLRPRPESAAATDRTGFLAALREELEEALPRIREGAIAPADLRQTVLGPGMAVYSRYSRVLEADGSRMSVKSALALINATFDAIETEQDADVDPDTRFCLDWYKSYGWAVRPYGDAESLAVPLGLSVDGITRGGVLTSGGGKVTLIKPLDLDPAWNPAHDDRISVWEATCHLARTYAQEGREAAARLMAGLTGQAPDASSAGSSKVSLDDVQRLALRLYELMETKDPATAGLFNGIGGAWAEVAATAQNLPKPAVQDGFDFDSVTEETS
ncbi:hypothetical protein, partial [Myceligenerans crystallogenes]|uniref:DUF1156 domain-containing protein n=1 Tax=Myceligenerans crystallogenes TaxID=316335 RepID=UPI0031E043F1